MNEGGNTSLIPRPFTGRGFFNFMVTIQAYAETIRFSVIEENGFITPKSSQILLCKMADSP